MNEYDLIEYVSIDDYIAEEERMSTMCDDDFLPYDEVSRPDENDYFVDFEDSIREIDFRELE